MEDNIASELHLRESWLKLDPVCRRLWDSDSPLAVDLQAIIEEFKGEVHRAEQMVSTLRRINKEVHDKVTKELQRSHSEEIWALQVQIKNCQDRNILLDSTVAQKEQRIEDLLKELAAKEALNVEFHDTFLKNSADQDEARSKKMETFYKNLTDKETQLEGRWEIRHEELETQHKQRTEALQKKHADLVEEIKARVAAMEEQHSRRSLDIDRDWERLRTEREAYEAQRLSKESALAKRKDELAQQAETLADEYKKKQAELQRIKESLQSELAEVVRQYHAKMHGPSD